MNFEKHLNLEGKHAFLGASKYHWLNYDEEKLVQVYFNQQMVQRGTELHEFACDAIRLGIRLPRNKNTLNMYVNDAIGYKMTPEVILYYSDNCFGTADSICFRDNYLRIHDFKSGVTAASMDQLKIYASLFFLEYFRGDFNYVKKCKIELRIYQSNDVIVEEPDPEEIRAIMNKIITFDKKLNEMKEELA